ncbi:MAG: ABC transporter substrate-binding protein [Anaerolineae bacterium]|jgi:ABC-type oligopeptide transport system substrate-binding subunit/class 3 adenylate cyclase
MMATEAAATRECPACGAENRGDARFCFKCGASLGPACPKCGRTLPPEAAFCDGCGAQVGLPPAEAAEAPPVSQAIPERIRRYVPADYADRLLHAGEQVSGERRMVTILFSDVKGSTAMAEELDPEDVMDIMDGAFDVLIEPIYRHEGTLARLMGDAILAFFGAPIAHEDDAERACRAALEIVKGAQAYAELLLQERGIEGFNVRVGINTGLVVVGEVGSDLRVEYTAMGDAINLAARMESAAEPGMILITENTHRLVSALFETDPLGTVAVKGKAEPVRVYRVLSPKTTPADRWHVAGLDSPVVGREAEFSALCSAVDRLRAGVGGIVTLVGDAGIGKSRLVAEVRKKVPPAIQWLEGRCLSYGTSIAYLLWLDVLRGWLGHGAEDAPTRLRDALQGRVQDLCPQFFDEVYPFLGWLLSLPLTVEEEALVEGLEGEELKRCTFHALEMLVACAASDRPLVLVCEDLHWADSTSTEFLERLIALTDRAPLLLVCVLRPETDRGSWRIKEVAARDFRHRHSDLWLGPLSPVESETLVSNLLHLEPRSRELGGPVVSRAEGNPFFVEEIIRSLINEGALVKDEKTGHWEATRDLSSMTLPDTLHGVLRARIDRLNERDKRVLQIASVIGRILPHPVLASIAANDPIAGAGQELGDCLLTLQREEMIRERARLPEREYIFKHELTREAAYRGLLKKERRTLHRQVAETLERMFADRIEEQVGLLALHWERATELEKALPYFLRAGDQARALYAHAEAERSYVAAVRILEVQDSAELAASTLMKLGLVYTAAFQSEKAREAYEKAFALWEPLRESDEMREQRAPAAVLRFAVEEPLTLDPGKIADDVSTFVAAQLFEGLVEVGPDYNVLPAVAARWEMSDGGTRYVFRLRDGLRWSDGTPLTAGDFEYAWKRNLNPATRSPAASLLYVLRNARAFGQGAISDSAAVGATALDDLTLEVRLQAPTAYLPHLMAHTVAYPMPRWAVETHGEGWTDEGRLVSNGAYELREWKRGERLVLGKNPVYRGQFPGNAKRVDCPILADFGARLEAYAADAVDLVSMITSDPATLQRVRALHGHELLFIPRPSTFCLVFRSDMPPFDDRRVRKAFVHAVERESLAEHVFHGQILPGSGGFVPPGMPAHSAGIGLKYDPDRARRLLGQAGYPGGQGFPAVTWIYSGGWEGEQVIPFLQDMWRDNLGLDLRAQSLEWGEFVERLEREPANLSLFGWSAGYPDPDDWLRGVFHSEEGRNDPRWHNARFDALVEKAARIADQARRMELYREADRILVAEEAAIMPLRYGRGRILVKPCVTLPQAPCVPMRLRNVQVHRKGN